MANLYDSTTPPRTGAPEPPASGLSGAGGYVGAIWSSLGETWGRITKRISFWSVITLVAILTTVYYYVFAESLYDSQAILSIQIKGASASGVGSILSSTLGTSGSSSQSQQIYEYIQSMDMLKILDKKYHLREVYSDSGRNPFWKLYFPQTDENFLWFYQHMVELDSQSDVGIMTIDVLDYDRDRAHAIAESLTQLSEKFINDINAKMQTQTMKFAREELLSSVKAVQTAKDPQDQSVAEMRLSAAQQALASAEGAANQQSIFIVPISVPSVPTETTEPQRIFNIITITFLAGIIYAVGFLMWSNVRDHRKA
jgi:capsular polysaccharide transport system permease protein